MTGCVSKKIFWNAYKKLGNEFLNLCNFIHINESQLNLY